ncbi:hypothetical protein JD844_016215 [Phrynosoma platyrhinos]|uniref:PLAT domain-containing protein n=1 Tax=Phrynosoma platyrhinos TaxID=52577 RepID=A0ABQ7SK27_PHRPL|nr:hypothetical protein JD844_016215 [Phrynosoma platyrhinos]
MVVVVVVVTDMFEIQAVSLGNLQKVLLCCKAYNMSQNWYCEKVIIREPKKNSEYIFICERLYIINAFQTTPYFPPTDK